MSPRKTRPKRLPPSPADPVLEGLGEVRSEVRSLNTKVDSVVRLFEQHEEMDCERLEITRGDIKEVRDDLREMRGDRRSASAERRKDWRDWLRGAALVVVGCALAVLARMWWP